MRNLILAGIIVATPAAGQESKPLDALNACRKIADNDARLACFDRESAALSGAAERRDILVMDKTGVEKTRRGLFGFTLPKLDLFGSKGDEGPSEIETTISTYRELGYGRFIIITPEGATWQTTEYSDALPRNGGKLTIKRAALGSYFLKFAGSKALRGTRTQ